MFRRSSKGLTKKYKEEYNSDKTSKKFYRYKKKPSFEQYILREYNQLRKSLIGRFNQISDSELTEDELKLKRRVTNSSMMNRVSDVSKNVSRAVKRLDVLRNIANSGEETKAYVDENLQSSLASIEGRLIVKYRFLNPNKGTKIPKSVQSMMRNASPEDLRVVFDFLNSMKKEYGSKLDEYYKQMLEDYYNMIQKDKQLGKTIDPEYISGEKLRVRINMFKIENQNKYNVGKGQLEDLIKDNWKNRNLITDSEERFIKKIAKRKLGIDLEDDDD